MWFVLGPIRTERFFMREEKNSVKRESFSKRIARMGVFVALAMIFSYVELLIPFSIGIPGIKLGIANLLVVTGLFLFPKREVFMISMVRIALMSMLFGNASTALYSFAGGIASFFVMAISLSFFSFSVVGISILGACFHNIGQLGMACLLLGNSAILSYLPILLLSGAVTGLLIGTLSGPILLRVKRAQQND